MSPTWKPKQHQETETHHNPHNKRHFGIDAVQEKNHGKHGPRPAAIYTLGFQTHNPREEVIGPQTTYPNNLLSKTLWACGCKDE